jgi:hypothetical protein
MFHDLSQTLKAILSQPKLPIELKATQISFERPDGKFTTQQNTLNLFLYDIRENVELRDNTLLVEHHRTEGKATIHHPSMRVDCTYLVTVWTGVGQEIMALQEHQLLGQVLQVLSCYPTIPKSFLQGELQQQPIPLPLSVGTGDRQKNSTEFWSALGIPPRAAFAVTITLCVDPWAALVAPPEEVKLVTERTFNLTLDEI